MMNTQFSYIGLCAIVLVMISIACKTEVPPPSTPIETTLEGRKVLFVHGGWKGHNPEECRDLYVPWLQSIGAEVTVSDSLGIYSDSVFMSSIDLVVQIWTMGEITKDQLSGLLAAVRNGTGIAGWHGGIVDAFIRAQHYHIMTGGQFLEHPGGIIPYKVNITDHEDPITRNVADFAVNTEQYYMLVDPNIEVLATTTFSGDHMPWLEGRTMPVIWKHQYGQGRVFVNTVGHNLADHAIPEFETTFKRGMVWAARK
jgi:type 1 glutamine amidotransferase